MEKQKKVERWSYPFKAKGSNGAASSEVIDPQIYYDALATAESGYYPVSSNGLWHGGVHFDQNTAGMLDQSSVRCIADGEVVAYRIDESYKKLTYTGSGTSREVTYSTGFVLVKHRLELPPAPTAAPPAGGTPAPATPPAPEPDLTFYSLYMHLKDWESYKQEGAPTPPTFLCPTQYAVSEEHATNDFAGLYVRGGAPGTPAHANKVSIIPKGCKVQVGAASPLNANWRKLVSVLEGQPSPALAADIEHWVFIGEMTPTESGDIFLIGQKANDVQASLLAGKGLAVRMEAKHNSAAMAVLPIGTELQLEDGTGKYRKIKSITAYSLSAPVSPECAANIQGFVHFESLKAVPLPPTLNAVHVLPEPLSIAAGALIGHLGKYQAASQGDAHDLLHIEVFSCDNVETFVAQSRARASLLKPEQKTLLKIPSETQVITREDVSQAHPPLVSDPGKPTAYDIIIPLAVLNALPAERKITVTTTVGGTTTTEQWWKLDRLPGKDGNEFSGWVKEQELMTPRLHPWDWDGFDFIKETSTPSQQYECTLSADGVLDDGVKTNQKTQINDNEGVEGGPIQKRLFDIIDIKEKDGKLTPEEIHDALSKPWHAQSISRLIAQYESEWYADEGLSKWEALNCYMTKEGAADWSQEKERIKSLLWWHQLSENNGIAPDGNAYHINPQSLISTMLTSETLTCKDCGKRIPLDYNLFKKIAFTNANQDQLKIIGNIAEALFNKYNVNSCRQVRHILGQGKVETKGYTAFRESLNYTSTTYTAQSLYNLAPTAINNGFARKGITFNTMQEKLNYIQAHLIGNDPAYGEHSFGTNEHPGKDYRGRGLLHLTHYQTYQLCATELGIPIDSEPDLVQSDMKVALETGLWFWKKNNIGAIAESTSLTTEEIFTKVTKKINTGLASFNDRKIYTNEIKVELESRIGACSQ